jgi:ribosomal protein L31E
VVELNQEVVVHLKQVVQEQADIEKVKIQQQLGQQVH